MSEVIRADANLNDAYILIDEAQGEYENNIRRAANIAALAIIEAGGITDNRRDFVLAMHGFDRKYNPVGYNDQGVEVYDKLEEAFGWPRRLNSPVARIGSYDISVPRTNAMQIMEIAFAKGKLNTSPLQYRILPETEQYNPRYRGQVLLPVKHNMIFGNYTDIIKIADEDHILLMNVVRKIDVSPTRHPVDIYDFSDQYVVGWEDIYRSRTLGLRGYEHQDELFLDRIARARAAFGELT